jgi:hypothetical protein
MITYTYTNSSNTMLTDGTSFIPCDPGNADYQAILAANAVIQAFIPPPPPPPECALWQLQSVMTANQWAAAQSAVTALNNPAVTAFFVRGHNKIPADSQTLISLGQAIGLDANTVANLVQSASQVVIP